MRVEQSNTSFNPVTITLDTQSELDAMIEVVNLAYSHSDSNSDAERLASGIREQISASGWQSSDLNC